MTLGVIEEFYNDTHQMILSSGVSSYTFTVAKNIEDSQYLVEGNYVIITDDQGLGWKFTIMNTTQTHTEITVYCEDIGLELVNKVMDAWNAPTTKQPASYYINKAIKDTKWKIGFNQISNLSRTLKWEGRDTSLNRLLSICTEFDHAEIEFRVKFHNLQVTDYIINIYKSRGANRSDIQLVYGETVDDITKSSSIEELATAMMGVGSDKELPENAPQGAIPDKVTFKNLTYDDGFFFTKMGDPFLRARVANQQFNLREGYIEDYYEYDTSDPQELLNRTITQLKERSEIKVNYEVSAVKFEKSLQLGDTITIIDHDYKPELLLSGRVLELDKSYTDASQDKLVLGNFLILYSNINDKLYNLQNQIKNMKVDSNYMWLRYAIDDKGTGMSATPTAGTKYFAILVNKKTGVPSDNPADYAGHWKLIQGEDGKDGVAGEKGADGKTSYTHFAYANDVSGHSDFSLDDPTGRAYMGVFSDFTKADSTNPDDYIWSLTKGEDGEQGIQGLQGPQGAKGIAGPKGEDGKTQYTHIAYSNSADGKTDFSQTPANHKYIGMYVDFIEDDSNDPTKYGWSLIKGEDGLDGAQGTPGKPGIDGKTSYTHIAYADTVTGGGFSQSPDNKKYVGMYVDFTENDSSDPNKYNWSLIKGDDGAPGKDGVAGKDGVGIKSTTVTYQASSNGTTEPTGAWTANVPKVPAGQYLWTRTIWTYTDNTDETSYSVAYIAKDGNSGKDGIAGKDGVGIKSTTITYATSTSGTATPTTGWVTNPPAVSPGQFMWTKTVWNYTDNSSETGYSVAQSGNTGATGPVGKDGIAGKDGVGIKSTAIAYAQSTSGTTPPTTGWTAGVPTLIKGQYLWTKTVWTYTDSSAETGYTVSYNAKDGNTGADGRAGKDGTGIKSTVIEYVGAVSGTSKPVNGWSATIPTVPAGQYLWTRTTWQYTDGTSEQGFTNALMGRTGPKGDTGAQGLQGLQGPTGTQGIAGPKGLDGKSSYTHIAYGTSNSGAGFTQTPSTSTTYIGMYVDQTATDSGDPKKYAWSLIKGADGANGTPGAKGADGKTPYFHSAWANSVDGKTGFSTTDSVNKSYLGTYTDFTQGDSADPTKYAWSLIKGADGINGKDGIPGKAGADGKTPYFHTAWATSADGKNGFSTTDSANKSYLGTYTDFAKADSTDTTKYSWSLIKGRDGTNGTPGKPGADGKTPYFHTAWADSKDGKINFNLSDATNRGYLGTYTDFTQADSSDPTKYSWTELVGNIVTGAPNLIRNSSEPDGSIAYWTVNSGTFGVDRKHSFWKNGRDTLFTLSTTGTNEVMAHTNYFGVVHDKEYTFQMEGFNNSQLSNGDIFLMYRKYSSTKEYDGFMNIKPNFILSTANAVQLSARFTMPAGAEEAYIRIDNNGSKTAGQVADLWFTNVKIAQENRPSPYQKAPEDVEESAAHQIGNPNLVYNAGLQGDYKGGLDGWFVNGTNLYYRTTVAPSLYNGVNGMGWNQTYTQTKDTWYLIDAKHYPVDMSQTYSASVAIKIYSDSTVGDISAVLAFYDDKGQRINGYYDMGTHAKDTLNGDVSANNPLRDKWQLATASNIEPPTGAKTVAIQYYAHHKVGVSSKIHTVWSAPVVNTGAKPLPYKDYQGNGADVTQVNEALNQANAKINAVPHVSAQSSAPTSPKKGDQWWVLDASGKATGFKVWNGSAWADSKIQQSLLNVVSLNAVTITGSTINGSKFTNNFDFTNAEKNRFQGVTTIGDGAVNITWKIPANNQTGQTLLNASGFQSVVNDSAGAIINKTDLLFGELDLMNRTSGTGTASKYVSGSLTAQDVYRGDTTAVQWLSGWGDWGNGNGLIHVTRNGYTVSVSGYPHHNNSANFAEVATLPAWARPPKTVNLSGTIYDSGVMNPAACKITIDKYGKIQVTNGKKGGYLIIGGTYVGQDIV